MALWRMRMTTRLTLLAGLLVLAIGADVRGQTTADDGRDPAAEIAARDALVAFMTAWNTGQDATVRQEMHFPFVTVGGGGALQVAPTAGDFSQGFDELRTREGWDHSSFDYDSLEVSMSSSTKVHLEVGFSRYRSDGTPYASSRVFYVVTKQGDDWALQLRSRAAPSRELTAMERTRIVADARQAVLDFFTAFNAGDAEGTVSTLNHPHVFMTAAGGVRVAEDPADGPRPDFEAMRAGENWHMSTIDALEASVVTRDKVHFDLTFTRWHPNGLRYWTVPALWIVTRAGDHWGIQVRSLLPATFDARPGEATGR